MPFRPVPSLPLGILSQTQRTILIAVRSRFSRAWAALFFILAEHELTEQTALWDCLGTEGEIDFEHMLISVRGRADLTALVALARDLFVHGPQAVAPHLLTVLTPAQLLRVAGAFAIARGTVRCLPSADVLALLLGRQSATGVPYTTASVETARVG